MSARFLDHNPDLDELINALFSGRGQKKPIDTAEIAFRLHLTEGEVANRLAWHRDRLAKEKARAPAPRPWSSPSLSTGATPP